MVYCRAFHMNVFLSVVLLLSLSVTVGEAAWQVAEIQSQATLYGVCFVSPNRGWVVGEQGSVHHTVDGGRKWIEQSLNAAHDLYDVSFANNATGWAIGDAGEIWQTVDAGSTWSRQESNVDLPLYRSYFLDASRGWIAGSLGTILYTDDGGKNWVLQHSGTSMTLRDVHFVNQQVGWAVGANGIMLHTTNGGKRWLRRESGVNDVLYGVIFVDTQKGWAVGDNGVVLHTTDGGRQWTSQKTPTDVTLYDVHFGNPQQGWTVGAQGQILETKNGGAAWRAANLARPNDTYALSLAQTSLWCVGSQGFVAQRTGIPTQVHLAQAERSKETSIERPHETTLGTGNLTLRSTPSKAKIYLNGTLHEDLTPTTLSELVPGRYEVRLTHGGHGTLVRSVHVKENETSLVNTELPSRNTMIGAFVGTLAVVGIGVAIAVGLIK